MIKSSTFNHLFFVYSSSVCKDHTVYLSPFLRSLFICLSSLHRLSFVIPSFFVHLPVRLAPSFVRLLFVFCSSFVRYFIICSCGSHRFLFVHFFVSLFRYYTPSPLERAGERIFCSSFLHLPVGLAPSFI